MDKNIVILFKMAIIAFLVIAVIVMISIIKSPFLLIGVAIFFIFNIIFLLVLYVEYIIGDDYIILEEIEDYDFNTIEGIEDYYNTLDEKR